MAANSLTQLFSLRNDFSIIALTGRTGSGCTTIANAIKNGFDDKLFPNPDLPLFQLNHNSYKKYRIIYNYAKENFKQYKLISYIEVLTLCLLKEPFNSFLEFLVSDDLLLSIQKHNNKYCFENTNAKLNNDFSIVQNKLKKDKKLKMYFDKLHNQVSKFDFNVQKLGDDKLDELHSIFSKKEFKYIFTNIHSILKNNQNESNESNSKHNFLFQLIASNLRKSGSPYNIITENTEFVFTIAYVLNAIIKSISKQKKEAVNVVIDSLRNPFEVMFFKQRFSAFYLISINRDNEERENYLKVNYKEDYNRLEPILTEEYVGGKNQKFYKQYVRECIEKADIHISYKEKKVSLKKIKPNKHEKDSTQIENETPEFSWEMQLLKYIALISHPGLVTPSPEERCMQMAYTAKYNSGCISRQVGAAITDQFYSIKAIGWNNTPEGQVPCLLRNADILNKHYEGSKEKLDFDQFTDFEKNDTKFISTFKTEFYTNRTSSNSKLKGRNVCFCFKSLHNACYDGKNQVHTRSLHAEESAFLQITKYGGNGIKGGKLFTTASPCELCSKKAYQLGIKVIYYIDPYPGISEKQILKVGYNKPVLKLFHGAIGNAYHWLYEPLMPYKDELSILMDINIKDLATKLKDETKKLKEEKKALEDKIKELECKNLH